MMVLLQSDPARLPRTPPGELLHRYEPASQKGKEVDSMALASQVYRRVPRGVTGDASALNLLALFLLAAILTAVLLPAYRNYTLREHTILAKAVLKDILARQLVWQKSHPAQRLGSLEDLGYATPAVYVSSDGTVRESANATSIYRVSLVFPATAAPDSCGLVEDEPHSRFVLVAEPIQTQRIETRCARLCMSSSGRRGATGSAGAEACWAPHSP